MSRRVEIVGKSGASYAFMRLDDDTFVRPVGVTYVIGAMVEGSWRVMHVGETNNLADRSWLPPLERIRDQAPVAECLIRLNVSRSVRLAEIDDISAAAAGADTSE